MILEVDPRHARGREQLIPCLLARPFSVFVSEIRTRARRSQKCNFDAACSQDCDGLGHALNLDLAHGRDFFGRFPIVRHETFRPYLAGKRGVVRVVFELLPEVGIAVRSEYGDLANIWRPDLARPFRPRLPLEHGSQCEIGIVERKNGLDKVHREPLPPALRGGLLMCVWHCAAMRVGSREEGIRRDADQESAGEVRIGGEVLDCRQRRSPLV